MNQRASFTVNVTRRQHLNLMNSWHKTWYGKSTNIFLTISWTEQSPHALETRYFIVRRSNTRLWIWIYVNYSYPYQTKIQIQTNETGTIIHLRWKFCIISFACVQVSFLDLCDQTLHPCSSIILVSGGTLLVFEPLICAILISVWIKKERTLERKELTLIKPESVVIVECFSCNEIFTIL